jgi:hypothetical protein
VEGKEVLRKKLSQLISECQDTELSNTIIASIIDAEESKMDTEEFYNSQISKLRK